jgi:hypothetical protein
LPKDLRPALPRAVPIKDPLDTLISRHRREQESLR